MAAHIARSIGHLVCLGDLCLSPLCQPPRQTIVTIGRDNSEINYGKQQYLTWLKYDSYSYLCSDNNKLVYYHCLVVEAGLSNRNIAA